MAPCLLTPPLAKRPTQRPHPHTGAHELSAAWLGHCSINSPRIRVLQGAPREGGQVFVLVKVDDKGSRVKFSKQSQAGLHFYW